MYTLSLIAAGLLFAFTKATKCPQNNILAHYYPAYSMQNPQQPLYQYTDYSYYFVAVTTESGFAIPDDQFKLNAFVKAAKKAGNKAGLTFGGWSGSRYFSTLASSPQKRNELVEQIKTLVVQYRIDLVDIDWEYPNSLGAGCNTKSSKDASNFLLLLNELRTAIGSKVLLTAAVASNGILGSNGEPLKDVSVLAKVLDYL